MIGRCILTEKELFLYVIAFRNVDKCSLSSLHRLIANINVYVSIDLLIYQK